MSEMLLFAGGGRLTWMTNLRTHLVAMDPAGRGVMWKSLRGVRSTRSGSKRVTRCSISHGALSIMWLVFRWSCHCLLSPWRAVDLPSINEQIWGSSTMYGRWQYSNRTPRQDLLFKGVPPIYFVLVLPCRLFVALTSHDRCFLFDRRNTFGLN